MNEIRITLISDATSEFPDNTNTNFKVRLQEPIRLNAEQQWKAAMVSLSTPNRPVTFMKDLGLKDQDTLFVYGLRILNEKYPTSDVKHIDDRPLETVSVGGGVWRREPRQPDRRGILVSHRLDLQTLSDVGNDAKRLKEQ